MKIQNTADCAQHKMWIQTRKSDTSVNYLWFYYSQSVALLQNNNTNWIFNLCMPLICFIVYKMQICKKEKSNMMQEKNLLSMKNSQIKPIQPFLQVKWCKNLQKLYYTQSQSVYCQEITLLPLFHSFACLNSDFVQI